MRFNVWTFCYVVAVFTTGIVAFGPIGVFLALVFVSIWAIVLAGRNRPVVSLLVFTTFVCFFIFVALVFPPVSRAGPGARRAQCMNRMKNISLALINYHEHYGTFPPAAVTNHAGKPLHSWRVLILPQLDEQELYNRYSFDEPWDGPNNSKLHSQMPEVLGCPSLRRGPNTKTYTHYVAVVGPETVWNRDGKQSIDDIRDGPGKTILFVETRDSNFHWMQPRDLSADEAARVLNSRTRQGQFSGHPVQRFLACDFNVLHFALADGRVYAMGDGTEKDTVASLLSMDGGEEIAEVRTLVDGNGRLLCQKTLVLVMFGVLVFMPAWLYRLNAGRSRGSGRDSSEHATSTESA